MDVAGGQQEAGHGDRKLDGLDPFHGEPLMRRASLRRAMLQHSKSHAALAVVRYLLVAQLIEVFWRITERSVSSLRQHCLPSNMPPSERD
jgi:hypothetical protein